MTAIVDIEGIGEVYALKLKEVGISTVEALLQDGATAAGRKAIVEKTGISSKLVLAWVNRADLYRIQGVGAQYSDLLEKVGVDTVPELAQRNPANLMARMAEVNAEYKLVRKLPTEAQVAGWVDQAKKLPRVVEY